MNEDELLSRAISDYYATTGIQASEGLSSVSLCPLFKKKWVVELANINGPLAKYEFDKATGRIRSCSLGVTQGMLYESLTFADAGNLPHDTVFDAYLRAACVAAGIDRDERFVNKLWRMFEREIERQQKAQEVEQ